MSTSFTARYVIAFCLISIAAGLRAGNTTPWQRRTVTPKWHADLRSSIGTAPVSLVVGKKREIFLSLRPSVSFADEKTIVATFITHKDEPNLSRRGELDENSPLRFRAVFLETSTGKTTTTTDWPTDSRVSGLAATHSGEFVTQTGNELILYSADLRPIKKQELPSTEADGWMAHSSPSGRSILFTPNKIIRTRSRVPWVWVDTDSLQIVRSWDDIQGGWVTISDKAIAIGTCVWLYDCDPKFETRTLDTDWQIVESFDRHHRPQPQFISDDLVALRDSPTTMTITRLNGEVVSVQDMDTISKGHGFSVAIPAANGQRFIVTSGVISGSVPALDIGGHGVLKQLLVYDAPFLNPSYVLDLKPDIAELGTSFALSPDGCHFAILKQEDLQLFDLPPLRD